MITVGVDGRVLHGARTGTGWYTAGLLAAMGRHPDVTPRVLVHDTDRRGEANVDAMPGVDVRRVGRLASKLPAVAARLPVGFDLLLPGCDAYLFPNFRLSNVRRGLSVTTIYDLTFRRFPELANPSYLRDLRRWAEAAIARSDLLLTPSETVRSEILALYDRQPESVIAARPGSRMEAVAGAVAARRGGSRSYALHVGTLEPRKDIGSLLEAYAGVPPSFARRCPLVLAGKRGWIDDALVAAIERLGDRVRWLGYVSDDVLAGLYAGAALVVSTSRYEGFGLPLLEAMGIGTPVACSDIPVHREVCGDAARYFEPGDPAAVAGAIMHLVDDEQLAEQARERGRRRSERFSWDASVAGIVAGIGRRTGQADPASVERREWRTSL